MQIIREFMVLVRIDLCYRVPILVVDVFDEIFKEVGGTSDELLIVLNK